MFHILLVHTVSAYVAHGAFTGDGTADFCYPTSYQRPLGEPAMCAALKETLQKVDTLQKVQTLEKVDTLQTLEKVDTLQKVQTVDTLQKVEKLDALQTLQTVQTVHTCYEQCRSGYLPAGGVCFGVCGGRYAHQCGLGCSSTALGCTEQLYAQISTPLILLNNIASSAAILAGAHHVPTTLLSLVVEGSALVILKTSLGGSVDPTQPQDLPAGAVYKSLEQLYYAIAEHQPIDWARADFSGIAAVGRSFAKQPCYLMPQ